MRYRKAVNNFPATCTLVNVSTNTAVWDGAVIACAVSCGAPAGTDNGAVAYVQRTEGSTASYGCSDGWELPQDRSDPQWYLSTVMSDIYSCRSSGLWASDRDERSVPPTCMNSTEIAVER